MSISVHRTCGGRRARCAHARSWCATRGNRLIVDVPPIITGQGATSPRTEPDTNSRGTDRTNITDHDSTAHHGASDLAVRCRDTVDSMAARAQMRTPEFRNWVAVVDPRFTTRETSTHIAATHATTSNDDRRYARYFRRLPRGRGISRADSIHAHVGSSPAVAAHSNPPHKTGSQKHTRSGVPTALYTRIHTKAHATCNFFAPYQSHRWS